MLQSIIGGVRESYTPDGERVDLLTPSLLIEVKAASDWDDAIGQVLKYKIHFPKHELVIFLFDDGLGVEKARARLLQIIKHFIAINIHVIASIEELTELLH